MHEHCNTRANFAQKRFGHRSHFAGGPWQYGGWKRPKYNVPLNIEEDDASFTITLYATGFAKQEISISVDADILYIRGKKEDATEVKFARQEFPVKHFERSVWLNGKVDAAQITAKENNGVLVITLPKNKAAQAKHVPVQ